MLAIGRLTSRTELVHFFGVYEPAESGALGRCEAVN